MSKNEAGPGPTDETGNDVLMAVGPHPAGAFRLTKVIAERPKILSKTYQLVKGELRKTTAAALSTGRVENLSLAGPEDLIPVLAGLSHAEALMLGVPNDPKATRLVTRRMLSEQPQPGTLSRTAEHIQFAEGPGFLFLDHDGLADGKYLSLDEIRDLLCSLCPALANTKIIAFPSSSSHIVKTDTGEDLTGARGVHLYIPVRDASDIARAGAVLADKAWLEGHGFIVLAKNGHRLFRGPFDASVWQANRVVFASGAVCGKGLEQHRGAPVLLNPDGADYLDTVEAFQPLEEATVKLAEAIRAKAHAEKQSEAEALQAEWIRVHRPAQLRALGARLKNSETAQTLVEAVKEKVLGADFTLFAKRRDEKVFKSVTVREVLADRLGYHGAVTLDPIEPDYNDRSVVGMLYLDGHKPQLHSFAHGGTTYRLRKVRDAINIYEWETREGALQLLERMSQDARFYNHADFLTTVRDGQRQTIDAHELDFMLAEQIRYLGPNRKGDLVPIELPQRIRDLLVKPIIVRQLRPLIAALNHPTISGDGTLLDRPGYYPDYGLYLDFDPEDWPSIVPEVSETDARKLVDTLFGPFRDIPFADAASRGAVLGAVLTGIMRASFETAPVFVSDAPVFGVGKTLAMEIVAVIMSGQEAAILPPFVDGDEGEVRKVLTSMVMCGYSYAIFDNLVGNVQSPTFQAFITASKWNDRPLATNKMLNGASTRLLIGLTGTNLSFSGDFSRRVITWRIDPGLEHGAARVFNWCPKKEALAKRKEIICAALRLVMAAQKADLPPVTANLGSFPTWERIVRTTLRYIEQIEGDRFADPVTQTIQAMTFNEDSRALHQLHLALISAFDWDQFTSRDILDHALIHEGGDLADALSGAIGRTERLSSKSIGRYLQRFVDRPVWGLVLRATKGQKALSYRIAPYAMDGTSLEKARFEAMAETIGLKEGLFEEVINLPNGPCRIEQINRTLKEHPVIAYDLATGVERRLSVKDAEAAVLCTRLGI